MPPVITAVVGFLVGTIGVGATVAVINLVTWSTLFGAVDFALGSIQRAIRGKPSLGSLSSDCLARTVTVRR